MRNRLLIRASTIVVLACSSETKLVEPVQINPVVVVLGTTGDTITYRVQGFTSFNNQFESIPSCLTASNDTTSHYLYTRNDTIFYHKDRRVSYIQNGTCGSPSPYNGGWVNVYEVLYDGDHYVGQVYGDMVYRDFKYLGSSTLTIKLVAYPDQIMSCSFQGFDNYGSQNPITVTGQGDLPLAQFACP
jgi:hypothetical protein